MGRDKRSIPPSHATRKTDLTRLLGLSRPTLDKILREPGCPKAHPEKGWSLKEMLTFVKEYAAKRGNNVGDLAQVDLVQLRMRKLLADVNKVELSYDLMRNKYVERAVLQAQLGAIAAEVDATFQRVFEQELPPTLVGLSAPEIRTKLRAARIEILTELNEKAKGTEESAD